MERKPTTTEQEQFKKVWENAGRQADSQTELARTIMTAGDPREYAVSELAYSHLEVLKSRLVLTDKDCAMLFVEVLLPLARMAVERAEREMKEDK